jgi:hypothetical protein
VQEFQVFRVLGSALRMKAQEDSSSRGRKDFICREEKRREEKRREEKRREEKRREEKRRGEEKRRTA